MKIVQMKAVDQGDGVLVPTIPLGQAPFHGKAVMVLTLEGWVQGKWVGDEAEGDGHFSCHGGRLTIALRDVLAWEDPAKLHDEAETVECVTEKLRQLETQIMAFNHRYSYGTKPAPASVWARHKQCLSQWDALKVKRDLLKFRNF